MVREKETYDALGEVIQAGRAKMELTQDEFTELVEISQRYLISVENESKKPSFSVLYSMIRALGVDANAIFFLENRAADFSAQRCFRWLHNARNMRFWLFPLWLKRS